MFSVFSTWTEPLVGFKLYSWMDFKKFEFQNFDQIIRFGIKNESEIEKIDEFNDYEEKYYAKSLSVARFIKQNVVFCDI